MKKRKVALFTYLILSIILCLLFARRFLPFDSYGADDTKVMIESKLNKYINYHLSEDDKGTLVQYEIKTRIEYGEEVLPVSQRETYVTFSQIDGQYPNDVKVITQNVAIEENSQYDETSGILQITANNQNESGDYFVIAYYSTYTEEEIERELETKVVAEVTLADEGNRKVSSEEQYNDKVVENIGELTSITSQTEDIYNGYMKSNRINGTDYTTEYKQEEQIVISKKEAQDTIDLIENNTFMKQEGEEITDLGNNYNLVYKSTQINKAEIEKLLGQEGTLEILDIEGNNLATINQDTEFNEDGTITIHYENELEAIQIRTSQIETEGILNLKHTKEIKNTMLDFQNVSAKTVIQMQGLENDYEMISELKEAQTTVKVDMNSTNWTNEQQNEITFDINLDASTRKNNMFRNPSLRIEFPSQVEKVILGESSLVYANGLELQEPYIETNENGNVVIVANLIGEQTQYDENDLGLVTNVKIATTIILKNDIESTQENIKLSYTNQYTLDGSTEVGSEEIPVQLEDYREVNQVKIEQPFLYRSAQPLAQSTEAIKLEVAPTKGGTTLQNDDVVYEGEYIKYNLKVTNTSNEDIENVRVVATIPDGVTYGELETNYYAYMQDYRYKFQEHLKEKTIEIGTIKAGKSVDTFYEVKVNDLAEGETTKRITTNITTYVGEQSVQSYNITNTIESSDVEAFVGLFNYGGSWVYEVNLQSDKNEYIPVEFHLPKGFSIEHIVTDSRQPSTRCVYSQVKGQAVEEPKLNVEISEDNTVITNLRTNCTYGVYVIIDYRQIERIEDESKVVLTSYVEANLNNKNYISNENRFEISYPNVKVSMDSSNAGEKIKYEEKIDYEITIENIGGSNLVPVDWTDNVVVELSDFLPEELEPISVSYDNWELNEANQIIKMEDITEDISGEYTDLEGNELPNVNIHIQIPKGETATIKVEATAGRVFEETKIENSAVVLGQQINSKETNTVEHIILPYNYTENNPENPEIPDIPYEPTNPDNPNIENYSISGVAWIDQNKDGKRSSGEKLLEELTVMLMDAEDSNIIKSTTKTNKNGKYEFSNLEQGNYLVVFKYDTNKYSLTEYQKSGVSSSLNSDVLDKTIMLSGKQEKVGITDAIGLNRSATNIDIGLIENKLCDFKIDKYINKVTIKTVKGTKEYNYDNKTLAKTEISAKEIDGATVTIEYKIVVTNVGEAVGKISEIRDYLPEELNFSDTQNNNWTKNTNGEWVNTSISNRKIEVGESLQLNLTATKEMTANDTGTFTNKASIVEKSDVNSSNNTASADIIISVSTGAIIYITMAILIVIILSILVIYLYKKGKINFKKINKITFLMVFTLVITISSLSNAEIPQNTTYTYVDGNYPGVEGHQGWFTGGPTNIGLCRIAYSAAWNGSYTYSGPYGSVIQGKPTISEEGNFTLEKVRTTHQMRESGNYYIFGPFSFNCSTNASYEVEVTKGNGTKVVKRNITICNASGTTLSLSGEGTKTFYVKITKNICNANGIVEIKLKATGTVAVTETRTDQEMPLYVADDKSKSYQTVSTHTYTSRPPTTIPTRKKKTKNVKWDIKGWLEIEKHDRSDTNIKLKDVTFNIKGYDYDNNLIYNQNHTTTTDGTILIENLPQGSYEIDELSNPNYGYDANLNKGFRAVAVIVGGKIETVSISNIKYTGNLQIKKVDKTTGKAIEGISFKIKSTSKGYIQAYTTNLATYQQQLVGENRLTNLTYTNDINHATEFITDSNGLVGIYNLLSVDTYEVHEVSVGKNTMYDVDDDYIEWNHSSDISFYNKSGKGHIATPINIWLRETKYTNSVTNVHDTLTVKNQRKYINLSGFVWEDLPQINKAIIPPNGLYLADTINKNGDHTDASDKLVEGIKVTLTDSEGNPVPLKNDSSGNTQNNPKTTDSNGEYRFEFVEIDKLKDYYITFEYNGMSYTNVIPRIKDEEGNEIPDASKATEGDNRTTFNENYQTITYEEQNGKVQGISENGNDKVYNINYDTTSASHESKLIYKTDANGREDKSSYNYGYENNEGSDPFSGVDEQYYILSDTRNAYEGQGLSAIKSLEEILAQEIEEIDNINLGLRKRTQVDLSLIKDINSVKVSINGAEHIYKYADRFKPELYENIDTYDEEGNKITNGYDIAPQVKYGSKYGNMSYTRALYPSDIHYKENENENANDKLKVEITYKIGISNIKTNRETDVTTTINELTDYYDNKYNLIRVGKEEDLNDDGTIREDSSLKNSVTSERVEGEYTRITIRPNLEIKGQNSIYVQLEVKPQEIVTILGNSDELVELDNKIEIISYSSKDEEGKIYAAIDKDSQPGNLNINDESTYEDDSDKAPGLKLVLQEERKVSGVVFVDQTTGNLMTGEIRQGDGEYNTTDGDVGIKNVEVRLVKANSNENETAKMYNKDNKTWEDAKVSTSSDGTYSIKGFVPDDYYIEFTWGGQKYIKNNEEQLIRVQEYKSTIVNEEAYNAKSENSSPEWYKDEFKKKYEDVEWNSEESVSYYDEFGQNATKQGAEIRVSDALDNYDSRQKIDKQSNNMTNRSKNVIDAYVEGSTLKNNEGLIRTMTSNTPYFKVNVEYFKDLTNSKEEYQVNPETGEVVTNGNYAVKREGYQNHLASIDFGIVERAKQALKLEKEVKHIKITLANGNVIVDANVIDNQLEGQAKHTVYIPESATNAQIKCEIDNELIQGSNLEITYGLKVTNMSELDYKSEEYYYYGKDYGDTEANLITLNPKQVIDYLDNNISTVNSKNDGLGEIKQSSSDKYQLITNGLLDTEMQELLDNTNRVLIVKKLERDLSPIERQNESEVTLIASKELTNTAVQDGITLDNSAEIIQVEKLGGAPVITMPGDYVASNSSQRGEVDDGDRAESVIITPPTGLSTNDIAYVILAISSLGVLISGIILIKKFVLR